MIRMKGNIISIIGHAVVDIVVAVIMTKVGE